MPLRSGSNKWPNSDVPASRSPHPARGARFRRGTAPISLCSAPRMRSVADSFVALPCALRPQLLRIINHPLKISRELISMAISIFAPLHIDSIISWVEKTSSQAPSLWAKRLDKISGGGGIRLLSPQNTRAIQIIVGNPVFFSPVSIFPCRQIQQNKGGL